MFTGCSWCRATAPRRGDRGDMCLGRAGKMPCLNPGISCKERCCPSRKNRQPWSPSSPRAVGLPWALPHPEVLELRGHWGSWHHPGRVSTQLRLRQCGKHPVLGSPAQTERWRRQLGSRRRMGERFSGAAASQERVTEQHSRGHFPSPAFSRNNTLPQTLWRLLWPCSVNV